MKISTKKLLPYLLAAVAAIIVLGFGKKLLQKLGLMNSDEDNLKISQQKAAAEAVLNTPVVESELSQPIGFYTQFAQDCASLVDDWFEWPSFNDSIISRLHSSNAQDIRQLVKSYADINHDKTLYQAIKDKFNTVWSGGETNRIYVAFDEAFTRADIKI